MIIIIDLPVETPCGTFHLKTAADVPIPSFDFSFILNFPPKWRLPWPDCSIVKRLNSAPEPPEDSHP